MNLRHKYTILEMQDIWNKNEYFKFIDSKILKQYPICFFPMRFICKKNKPKMFRNIYYWDKLEHFNDLYKNIFTKHNLPFIPPIQNIIASYIIQPVIRCVDSFGRVGLVLNLTEGILCVFQMFAYQSHLCYGTTNSKLYSKAILSISKKLMLSKLLEGDFYKIKETRIKLQN